MPGSRRNSLLSPLIGAIDEGTSSARFIIFETESTNIVAEHQEHLNYIYPQEGWVEQDPMVILEAVNKCIEEAIRKLTDLGRNADEIVAIGVANQRESTIVWDKETGEPLHNSVVWLDMRTSSTVDQLLDEVPNHTRNQNYLKPLCGLPISPYFSALKLRWLQDNIPRVAKAIADDRCLAGNVDSWLIWNLTGGRNGGIHVTDPSNASRTMLMNLERLQWDPKLLSFFEIDKKILPQIRSSSEVYGKCAFGPLKDIPISGCLGDQQAALVGQQCLKSGQAKATYGTGCFLLYNTGNNAIQSKHGLLTTVAYQLGPDQPATYALEGSVAVAGAALKWLRDNLSVLPNFGSAQNIAKEAEMIAGGDVVFVPAFSGLYAPYWEQDARGVICGISVDTTSSHIIKAALEAVCFQTKDVLDAMNKDYGTKLKNLQVDGGMTANTLLMQLQADITGSNILKPQMAESTALGAAMVAGSAVGMWNIIDSGLEIPVTTWTPRIDDNERDICYNRWKMAIERAKGWIVH